MNHSITTLKKDIIVYKKVENNGRYYIVEMLIEAGTKTYSLGPNAKTSWYKGRAERACVLAIYETRTKHRNSYRPSIYYNENINLSKRQSILNRTPHGPDTRYTVGKVVEPHRFSLVLAQCRPGIHFYIDPRRALEH